MLNAYIVFKVVGELNCTQGRQRRIYFCWASRWWLFTVLLLVFTLLWYVSRFRINQQTRRYRQETSKVPQSLTKMMHKMSVPAASELGILLQRTDTRKEHCIPPILIPYIFHHSEIVMQATMAVLAWIKSPRLMYHKRVCIKGEEKSTW